LAGFRLRSSSYAPTSRQKKTKLLKKYSPQRSRRALRKTNIYHAGCARKNKTVKKLFTAEIAENAEKSLNKYLAGGAR
jgi:hypothetical protein